MTPLEAARRDLVRLLLRTPPKGKRSTFGQLLHGRGLPAVAARGTGRQGITRWVEQLLGGPLPRWVMAAVLDVVDCWNELPADHPWRQQGLAVFLSTTGVPAAADVCSDGPPGAPDTSPRSEGATWRPPAFPAYSPGEDPRRRLREILRIVRAEWLRHVAKVDGGTQPPHLLTRRHLEWTAQHLLGHGVRAIARQAGVTPAAVSLAIRDARALLAWHPQDGGSGNRRARMR